MMIERGRVADKPGSGPLESNRLEDKEPNVFGFDGVAQPTEKALEVIAETHASWQALKRGDVPADGLSLS